MSYPDPSVFRNYAKTKTFYISEYARYKGIDLWRLYPGFMAIESGSEIKKVVRESVDDSAYMCAGSSYMLLADILFLNLFCDPLLSVDREEIRKFAEWGKMQRSSNS